MHRCIQVLLIVIASPLLLTSLLALSLLVRCKLGSPIIFQQKRIGMADKPFNLYKFRTMIEAYDIDGTALPDSLRLTSFGKLLRATSLDELPSFWNVLRGEMSLVGPRPLLPEYLPLYTPLQAMRHYVLPGITGWAQINGRNALSWEEKFNLDIWYVNNKSSWIDLKILISTLEIVVKRRGVTSSDSETMPRFIGTNR